jgi:hypothetical protein
MTDAALDAALDKIAANPPAVVCILLFAAAAAFVVKQLLAISE